MNKNLFALFALILAGLLYPFFVSPLWDEIVVRQNDKTQILEAQKSVDAFVTRHNELVSQIEKFSQTDLDKLSLLVPQTVDVLGTIIDIETIASAKSFTLKGSIDVEEKEQAVAPLPDGTIPSTPTRGAYKTTDFTISVVGPYSSLKPFLEALAKSLTLFDISSISFATGETGLYDFQIKLRTYSLSQ